MNTTVNLQANICVSAHEILQHAYQACARIAPTWPLDRFIAVNPWWGLIDQPLTQAATNLMQWNGGQCTMSPEWYQQAMRKGKIKPAIVARLQQQQDNYPYPENVNPLSNLLISQWLDQNSPHKRLSTLTELGLQHIGQHCGSWFDQGQALWKNNAHLSLYQAWQVTAQHDAGLALSTGIDDLGQCIAHLPQQPGSLIVSVIQQLKLNTDQLMPYFMALLLSIKGWASFAAYHDQQAGNVIGNLPLDHLQPSNLPPSTLIDLLAMRLAWDWILSQQLASEPLLQQWYDQLSCPPVDQAKTQWLYQTALELSWQQDINLQLLAPTSTLQANTAVALQAVFCIDVRSERVRRALEQQSSAISTHGFAGFFGLPIEYKAAGASQFSPQLPGLLSASLQVKEHSTSVTHLHDLSQYRETQASQLALLRQFKQSASSGFGFVETLGLGYAFKLIQRSISRQSAQSLASISNPATAPALNDLDLKDKAALCANILVAMGLNHQLAPVVLLTAHASSSTNNPHAAGLDCGACCGHSGEVNVRLLASLLNHPDIQVTLKYNHHINIPASTQFIAALHDTTTDHIQLFDVPAEFPQQQLQQLLGWLDQACELVRIERSSELKLKTGTSLLPQLQQRAKDWAQVRPEWGLANNAGFIAAPRQRSKHIDLQGRCFLHDYNYQTDSDLKLLELILTAPMIVAHWINMQYYTSTVDNQHWGSGNKVLHNIVGGNIGVFEGNGGDLRLGLPMQSLHDGEQWIHTPQRLCVWVEAPKTNILEVVQQHTSLQQLVAGEWLYLNAIDPDGGQIDRLMFENHTWQWHTQHHLVV
ncbi:MULTISPECIES: YbcC family protein [Acinetobacter]|jgi:uncharacterized protein YbcC (UPF0753/DUF2309 family)|uniref:YbcC family protein n=1 Tax=Acinetobacter TaxID=469 RepID=UPI0008CA343C|nr:MULTISPECIES: DUF2309 domain-containing protein [Acinetobacter]MCJ0830149.1 DUF2309 domain-containing protein [Acinetobacter sp. NIPH1876]OFW46598.1 MAG: hypothetical protein A2003_12390 [Acinetobacter sp. GWC1_38_13]WHR57442.1 DUF2309 domain-containing protein [Acinetobacter haemolyticus]